MKKYIIRRLLQIVPLILGISVVSFLVMHLAPGDPTALFIDPNISPEELLRVKANWGLDQPLFVQYFKWLFNAMKLDFGTSYLSGQPVILEMAQRIPNTVLLMGISFVLTLLIAIPLGVISAVKKNSFFDNFVTFFSFAGMAIPSFWLGLMLMLLFSVKLQLFPTTGNIVLPVLTMTIGSLAGITRYQRSSMLEVLNQDFVKVLRAKGLSEKAVIFKHALRNALIPIITLIGLSIPDLFSGAFIIETVFSWPGMGRLGVQAIFSRNYPMIMGIVVFSSLLIVLGNLFADIGYAISDPRIRYDEK